MATHSSILAWGILWTEEPGGLQSEGLQRVRHDWATNTFNRYCVGFKVNQELVQTVLVCLFKINLFTWYHTSWGMRPGSVGGRREAWGLCILWIPAYITCVPPPPSTPAVPNLVGTRDWFLGRQFFHGPMCGWGVVSGWFKFITFIIHFISITSTSVPPQMIRHWMPEVGAPWYSIH